MSLRNHRLRQAYEGDRSEGVERLAKYSQVDPSKLGLINRDLAIGGIPLAEAPKSIIRVTVSIVAERHQAVNWLLGDSPIYSKVSTSYLGMQPR